MATDSVDLAKVRTNILKRIAGLAEAGEVSELARWTRLAQECDGLMQEQSQLHDRIAAFTESLERARSIEVVPAEEATVPRARLSARLEGAAARSDWLARLEASGIRIKGSGKRFVTPRGASVSVGFANELQGLPNKWFLGTADEPTDVVVLLCRDKRLKVYDLVIPVEALGGRWRVLARSNGQIKFNVRRDVDRFLLLIPGGEPFDATPYRGAYGPLNRAA